MAFRGWIAAGLTTCVALTGCVGGDEPAQAVGTQPSTSGGTLRIGTVEAPLLDPLAIDVVDPVSVVVIDAMFDGLTQYDVGTRSVVGAVAASWSTDDGQTWLFALDPTRTFADGTPIRPEDVIRSIERVARSDRQRLAGGRLEIIAGMDALRDGSADHASGLSVDGLSVKVVLTGPNRELPALLADPTYGVVPPGFDDETVVGSGPFGGASRDGAVVVLRPSLPESGNLDGVTVRVYGSPAEVATAFGRDEIDVMVGPADGTSVSDSAQRMWTSSATLFVGVNTQAPKLADEATRRALLAALDPAAVESKIGTGRGRVVDDLVPGDWYPVTSCDDCFAAGTGDLSAVFGADDIGLIGLGSGAAGTGAAAVEAELATAGLSVTRPDDTPAGVRAAVLAGEWDLVVFAQVGVAPTADPVLGGGFTTGGRENLTGWSNPAVDALVAAARTEVDPGARAGRYAEAEVRIRRAAVARPLLSLGSEVLASQRVQGAEPVGGLAFDVRRVSLAR